MLVMVLVRMTAGADTGAGTGAWKLATGTVMLYMAGRVCIWILVALFPPRPHNGERLFVPAAFFFFQNPGHALSPPAPAPLSSDDGCDPRDKNAACAVLFPVRLWEKCPIGGTRP